LKYSDCRHVYGGNKIPVIDLFKLTTSRHHDHTDNNCLTGLTGATYILKCLSKGYSKNQIILEKFSGDRQLVSAWIEFLKDKNWVVEKQAKEKEDEDGTNLKVTKKGKMWLNRFKSADI
jgi:hypothetical protein